MNQLFSKPEMLSALQAMLLGMGVGALFAFFKMKPPSPDNLAGIFGILGIFLGWVIIGYIFQK
ncbi:MAG: DUF1427 family protein [Candidatus Marinimicrobia bacterium]|jgi:XapX domain-containing protein|nr:DUF1427 family protein [Candidatus Neomarinimicrobiota bacterium]